MNTTGNAARLETMSLDRLAVDGYTPRQFVEPATYEEAAAFLAEANAAGRKIAIRGGGTKSGLGNLIEGLDVVLGTGQLNKILEYSPGDLTLGVQAGVKLADLQAELEKHGQFLPVESPLSKEATIGGAIAANTSGPTRLQYGPARDWLVGVRFALPGGRIAHGGGRVVKNVAGFDLMKIFTGSFGTLGLLLDLNFKLLPLPKASSSLVITFPGPLEAGKVAHRIIDKGLSPVAETILDETAAASLGLPARPTLLVEVRNTVQAVERQVREIAALAQEAGATGLERLAEKTAQRELWTGVTDFAYRPALDPAQSFSLKVCLLPGQSPAFLQTARQVGHRSEVELAGLAHAGHGILLLTGSYSQEDNALKTITELRIQAEKQGGTLLVERAPLSLKQRVGDVWGDCLSEGELRLMRGIKQKLDPNRTLNPGRFVSRI